MNGGLTALPIAGAIAIAALMSPLLLSPQALPHRRLRFANVIVPGPWLPEAARLLKENPGIDAGVHLALTSEWSDAKWRPLTQTLTPVAQDFSPVL